LEHLRALQAQEDLEQLNKLLEEFRQKDGRVAGSLQEVVAAGYLPAIPIDPTGEPYRVAAGGKAALSPRSTVDLRLLQ
jgi:hypothetical protein